MSNYITFYEIMLRDEAINVKKILNNLFRQKFLIYLTYAI
jgi:hypothetical protein